MPERRFPWNCPRCRRREVRRTTILYQCERFYKGKSISLEIPDFAVPKCENCGELVFDYVAEEQINKSLQMEISALVNGTNKQARRSKKARQERQ